MRDKAIQLKPLLTDRNALSQCDTEIRECQKYIDYFHDELAKIELRKEHDNATLTNSTTSSNIENVSAHGSNIDLSSVSDGGQPLRSSSTEGRDIKKYSTLGTHLLTQLTSSN
jgi:hypothetical protein